LELYMSNVYQPQFAISPQFSKVVRYVQRWRVSIVFTIQEMKEFAYIDDGPLWGKLDYPNHKIGWPLDPELHITSFTTRRWVGALIHELAHCLASSPPRHVNEPCSEMLGFEYYSLRYLRTGGWSTWMHNYGTPDGTPWQNAPIREKHTLISASAELARECGLLDKQFRPTFCAPWATR
jgi:hypothetical protein